MQQHLARKQEIDKSEIEKEIYQRDVVEKDLSKKRQEIAKRRAKLGFDDKGATEMDDETIEKIEHMKMTYNMKKKPIDLK